VRAEEPALSEVEGTYELALSTHETCLSFRSRAKRKSCLGAAPSVEKICCHSDRREEPAFPRPRRTLKRTPCHPATPVILSAGARFAFRIALRSRRIPTRKQRNPAPQGILSPNRRTHRGRDFRAQRLEERRFAPRQDRSEDPRASVRRSPIVWRGRPAPASSQEQECRQQKRRKRYGLKLCRQSRNESLASAAELRYEVGIATQHCKVPRMQVFETRTH
jgi:hypothetical protein